MPFENSRLYGWLEGMRKRIWGFRISAEDGWSLNRFRVRSDGMLICRDEKHLLNGTVSVVSESFLPQLLFWSHQDSIHPSTNDKTMLKSLKNNIYFSQREKTFFHRLEEELMMRSKRSKSGCHKQALLEYHARLTQSAAVRWRRFQCWKSIIESQRTRSKRSMPAHLYRGEKKRL